MYTPDPRLPTNATGHLSHKAYTFVLMLSYTRVRGTENPNDPGNTPRHIKMPFLDVLFLPQCHNFTDIPEYSMKHFQQAWSGKPVYVNHDYNEEPVGQHLAGFLSEAGGLPKSNDEESTYNKQPIKFYGYYSLAAIENEKIPWILQTLKATKLENLDVSIGYIAHTQVDPEDIVRDKDGDEDVYQTRVYEKNFMPLECSFVARGNGACPLATVKAVYSQQPQECVLYENEEGRMARTLVQDAKKFLGVDWDTECVISKELRDMCIKLHKKGKLSPAMKEWVMRKGLRVYIAAAPSEAADKSLVGQRKNTIWYLNTRKNNQTMSTGELNPTTQPVSAQGTGEIAIAQDDNVQPETTQDQLLQPNTETCQGQIGSPPLQPQAKTFSTDAMDPVADAEGNNYTLQIPAQRAEMRKVFTMLAERAITEDDGKTLTYGIIAKDKQQTRAKKYHESEKQKATALITDTASSMGVDFKSPKHSVLRAALEDPDSGEFLIKLLHSMKNQQAPPAPVVPRNKQMSQQPQQPISNVAVPAFARPTGAQITVNSQNPPTAPTAPQQQQQTRAPMTIGEIHSEALKNLAKREGVLTGAPVENVRCTMVNGWSVPIVPDGPRRHSDIKDPAAAKAFVYSRTFGADTQESDAEMNRNIRLYGSTINPNNPTPLAGLMAYKKSMRPIRPGLNLADAMRKYSDLGDGSIEYSSRRPTNASKREDFSTVEEDGTSFGMPSYSAMSTTAPANRGTD